LLLGALVVAPASTGESMIVVVVDPPLVDELELGVGRRPKQVCWGLAYVLL
jgi:hypothetical protein